MGKNRVLRVGGIVLLTGLAASCNGSSPSSSTAPAAVNTRHRNIETSIISEFALVEGSFTIASRSGDGIAGVYSGAVRIQTTGGDTSSLTMLVQSGTGAFAGASGSLSLVGRGAMAGDGEFELEGGGDVTLAGGKQMKVAVTLGGRSAASCSASTRIAISQVAEGTMRRAGRVEARLAHEVANTGCSS